MLGDVVERFLHEAIGGQFAGRPQVDRLDGAMHHQARGAREIAREDLQRVDETQVAERRWAQVLGDLPLERNAVVEQPVEVRQPIGDFWRHLAQLGLEPRGIELGSGEQRSEFVVQLAREVAAFVFARRLQVLCKFGQLSGAVPDLGVEPLALDLGDLLLLGQQLGNGRRLSGQTPHGPHAQHGGGEPRDATHERSELGTLAHSHAAILDLEWSGTFATPSPSP